MAPSSYVLASNSLQATASQVSVHKARLCCIHVKQLGQILLMGEGVAYGCTPFPGIGSPVWDVGCIYLVRND